MQYVNVTVKSYRSRNNEGLLCRFDCKFVMKTKIKNRLEYLRREINAERISYGEILELQSLSEYIEQDDVLLREWAGIPEFS